MADVRIKIGVQDGYEDVITSVSYSQDTNNVSRPTSYKTTENNGKNLKSWATGFLSLKDGYVGGADSFLGEQGKYNGFMFGAVSPDGQYTLTLTIDGSNIDSVTVFGDRNANQFPIRAYLDGDNSNYIFSDDPQWTIIFPNKASSHTITFDLWNRPNYNACLTHIAIFANELWFDNRWIKNIESLSQSNNSPNEIFYGVLENSGNIEIVDRNGEILDYVNDGIVQQSGLPIDIYANGKKVQSHMVYDSNYSNMIYSLSMTNSISKLKNYILPEQRLEYGAKEKTLYSLLYDAFVNKGFCEEKIFNEMLNEEIIVDVEKTLFPDSFDRYFLSVENYLRQIVVADYSYYRNASTLYDFVDKICKASGLILVEDDNGKIKFISARPINNKNKPIISIPKKNQFSKFEKDIFINNKYSSVDFEYEQRNSKTDIVVDFSANLRDGYDVLNLEELEEAKVITLQDGDFLCFFVKTNISATTINNNVIRTSGSDPNFPALIRLISDAGQNTYYTLKTFQIADNEETIETFNFNRPYEGTTTSGGMFHPHTVWLLPYYSTINSDVFAIRVPFPSGNKFKTIKLIIREKVVQSIQNSISIGEGDNSYAYSYDNEFLSSKLIFKTPNSTNGREMYDILGKQIIFDYEKGITTGRISISCNNYYDTDGNMIKDWKNGDIIQVGDFVQINKDNEGNSIDTYEDGSSIVWKVTGRTFRKQGVPMIDLELQEVKIVELKEYTINYPQGNTYGNFIEQIDGTPVEDGQSVVEGTVLLYKGNNKITNLYINGTEISSGQSFVVKENIYMSLWYSENRGIDYIQSVGNGDDNVRIIYNPHLEPIIYNRVDLFLEVGGYGNIFYDVSEDYQSKHCTLRSSYPEIVVECDVSINNYECVLSNISVSPATSDVNVIVSRVRLATGTLPEKPH